ncbi:MAG: hypothetical protein AAFN94_12535 [Pseudomonadota bacterium]
MTERLEDLGSVLSRFDQFAPTHLPKGDRTSTSKQLDLAKLQDVTLPEILAVSDAIYGLGEREFWGIAPRFLKAILFFRDDPAVGNLFHIFEFSIFDSHGRASLRSVLEKSELDDVLDVMNDLHMYVFGCAMDNEA